IEADIEAVSQISAIPKILEVICRTTGMGFAAVVRVTKDRWVACAVRDNIQFGLVPGGELKLETTICDEIEKSHKPVVIDHVAEDKDFCSHHTPAMYGFQSYISYPIILHDGSFFGTLCAIDPKPARLKNTEVEKMFQLFVELIVSNLNTIEKLDTTEKYLLEERKTAELREQFIAILGHDLRNPLGAVWNSAQLLQRMKLDDNSLHLVNIIQNSSYRMTGLIENILDFARGRLGGGIIVNRQTHASLETTLVQIVSELRLIWPDRVIETYFRLTEPVDCDNKRIAQLFSNLLGNALKFGKPKTAVKIEASSEKGEFILSVCNAGNKIPDEFRARLFQPFSRVENQPNQQGLGLGLFISSEIAKAHKGILEVVSNDEETRFTLRFPAKVNPA
ncbi:MAG: GAF domain-containing sensor histidine kinase, partial [Chitinophagaceae bacterium]